MSFNSPAAAVGCYSTGEEIANSVTHGVAALLSIARAAEPPEHDQAEYE